VDHANACAYLKVVEAPSPTPRLASATSGADMMRVVVNAKPETLEPTVDVKEAMTVQYVKLRENVIRGKNVYPVKGHDGKVARLSISEGLWEIKEGRKIDGGERRRAEVRAKRRGDERKKEQAAAAAKA